MSLEDSDCSSIGRTSEPQKKSKKLYSRKFLLLLSNLDVCKKLPNGFDTSLLRDSEFEHAFIDANEGQRTGGGLNFQGLRRNDHGLIPQYKTESSGDHSRGNSGRWEPRSSGSYNRDGDSDQGDAGRRFGNQSRRSWQSPEHDGLLGSGAFPRTSGYLGPQAPRGRTTGQFQLNRSSEPYQPPRPYKAVPFQRKDHDSRNDETFGSAECSSEDRAEEEKRRRASFELMRKEQHKQFHDKLKQVPENDEHGKAEELLPSSQNDNSRSTTVAQTSVSRPLVPPGFASAIQDKNPFAQSSNPHLASETKIAVADNLTLDATNNELDKSDQFTSSFEVLTHVSEKLDPKDVVLKKDYEVWKENNKSDAISKREERPDVIGSLNHDSSTSILEKLFGNALPINFGNPPANAENESLNMDEETWSPATTESSKFARWFSEEDKKSDEDSSSKDLLSLIINSEKVVLPASGISSDKAVLNSVPTFKSEINLTSDSFLTPPSNSSVVQTSVVHPPKPDSNPSVLTCEDLEQFMLAGVGDNSLERPTQEPWTQPDMKSELKVDSNDHASLHILSLLQKGTTNKDKFILPTSSRPDTEPFGKFAIADTNSQSLGTEKANHSTPEASSLQKTLTLEALFGAAFMNELQSAEVPVSAKRVSDEGNNSTLMVQHETGVMPQYEANNVDMLQSHVSPFLYTDNVGNADKLDHAKDAIAHYTPGTQKEPGSTVSGLKPIEAGFAVGASNFQLPEEDNFISVPSEPFKFIDTSKPMNFLPEKVVGQLHDKLTNVVPRDGDGQATGLDGLPPFRVMQDQVDPLYHHLQGATPQLTHLRNQPRLPFPELEHRNQPMKFISPEGIHHDPQPTFPSNLIPPNAFSHVSGPRYDHSTHNSMLPRMPFPGNFPQQIPVRGLPRGIPASHPINQMQGYMPELSNMHNIPMHQQKPNYGGIGMGVSGSSSGGSMNHPEAFQRLLDMELRAKQVHPSAAGHFPGIYGPDFEPNFRYS